MDGNKDESEKCIAIALKAISIGDKEKAKRFLDKALRLYPSKKAKQLLETLDQIDDDRSGSGDSSSKENVRQRQNHSRSSRAGDGSDDASNKENAAPKDYTPDQLKAVKRINATKDVYQILEVSKDFKENELKKAYRKLALQFHPDKNKAPGATEAFKAVSKAYSILSDSEKKRQYDLHGPDFQSSRPSHREDYSHGFDGDISPEELFNMFFGGGFPSGATQRHNRHFHRQGRSQFYSYQREAPQGSESGLTMFFQLAPIILLVVLSMLSSFFVSDPVFSLHRNMKYNVHRKTSSLKVDYYVKEDFRIEFKSDLHRIDRAVEEEFVGQLKSNCFRERSNRENMKWRARNYGNQELYKRAENMETPSCGRLNELSELNQRMRGVGL